MHSRLSIAFLVLLFSLASCQRDPSPFEISNLNGDKISAFGHAGMGLAFKYPINSYESLEACLRIGANGTETDVQLTKDSILVLYHDGQLETSTSLHGMVYEHRWSELESGRYASPFSTDVRLLRADELIGGFNDSNRIFTFDCKLDCPQGVDYTAYCHTYARALIALIKTHHIEARAFIESADAAFLAMLKEENAGLHLFIYPENFTQGLAIADAMDLFGITISNHDITAKQVEEAHLHGRHITVWDLHTESDNIDAIKKSPDYMQSDKIIHLLQIFDGYEKQGWKSLRW